MLALMLVQIYQASGYLCRAHSSLDYVVCSRNKSHNGPVMIRVRLAVQQHRPGNGLDGANDLIQDVHPASFAEIGNAFYDCFHVDRVADLGLCSEGIQALRLRNKKSYPIKMAGAKRGDEGGMAGSLMFTG